MRYGRPIAKIAPKRNMGPLPGFAGKLEISVTSGKFADMLVKQYGMKAFEPPQGKRRV